MGASGKKKIGVDFDNTIINYDAVFLAAAKRLGLVAPGFGGGKEQVRDVIRELPDGEHAWQRLQGHVYGTAIMDAVMFDGVEAFLRGCRAKGYPVSIVSHKTSYGQFDATRVNLRQAALDWMTAHGFFQAAGIGLQTLAQEGRRAMRQRDIARVQPAKVIARSGDADECQQVGASEPSLTPSPNAQAGQQPRLGPATQ